MRVKNRALLRVDHHHAYFSGGARLSSQARQADQKQHERRDDPAPQNAEIASARFARIPHPCYHALSVARSKTVCTQEEIGDLTSYSTRFQSNAAKVLHRLKSCGAGGLLPVWIRSGW